MRNILLLLNSEDMIKTVNDALERTRSNDIEVLITRSYEDSLAKATEFERNGGRIVIARGAHARYLRRSSISLPVTDIPFTGNNIVPLMVQAAKDWGEFAVAGNPTMIQMARELERPIGAKIHYVEITHVADFDSVMTRLRSLGVKAVIGGYDASKYARAYGMHDYCIKTNEYEIVTAILEARNILSALDRDRSWDVLFRSALDAIGDGVLVAASDGSVKHANRRAIKLLGENGVLSALRQTDIKKRLKECIASSATSYDEIFEKDGHKLSVSFVPLEDVNDHAIIVVQEVEYVHKIERKLRQKLANKGLVAKNTFDNILGSSPALRDAVKTAKQYAVVDSSVLISGETGTGKEMFAQSIHNFSRRSDEAFVAVNCATIPANLLESELFGYVEGAFTGAKRGGKVGLFELAHKGTIFLDEIGETSLDMQARLLRVLEEHEIMRVGDDKVIPVDIRVIAASNRDLRRMVDEGTFRSDFYYRLDVLSLQLPPLRECKENIVPLIDAFGEKYADKNGRRVPTFTESAVNALSSYDWPGNVRELKNIIERLVVINPDGLIDDAAVWEALHIKHVPVPEKPADDAGLMNLAEMELIRSVLAECGGNKTAAAKKLGISRPTLHRKLKLMEGGDES